MSLLIKGMEMPNNGEVIVIHSDGYAEKYSRSDVAFIDFPISSPRKVAKIPAHGRLIDADALINHSVMLPRDGGSLPVVYLSYLRNAPIIIEAEEGE